MTYALYWYHNRFTLETTLHRDVVTQSEDTRAVLGTVLPRIVAPSDIIATFDTVEEADAALARANDAWTQLTINVEAAQEVLATAIKLRRQTATEAARA